MDSYQQPHVLLGFPEKMAILDCETTGGKAIRDRIIELAIILVDQGEVTDVWSSLINPETSIPPWITKLTGIESSMLSEQPTFAELWPSIEAKLTGRVLVAHNARFDYGFLKNEVKRCNAHFSAKTLCSVKLSRQLYPQYKRHGLDAVIQRLGCHIESRHRALDDTKVIVKLFEKISEDYEQEIIEAACQRLLKRPSLPSQLNEKEVNKLPDSPGVYYFYNENNRLLYVGKSINLKTRVLSHFYQDHQTRVDHHLSHQLHHIDYKATPSDFGAQLLEATEIKQLSPSLNRRLRKVSKLYQFKLSTDAQGYLTSSIQPVDGSGDCSVYGLFRSRKQAEKRLDTLVVEYFLCQRLSGLDKATSGACFAHQLKKCLGACVRKEPPESYNLRVKEAMQKLRKQQWPYPCAILVEEFNAVTEQRAFHLVNDWCYLGQIQNADELWAWQPLMENAAGRSAESSSQDSQALFDLDIYFILIRFLLSDEMRKKHQLAVHLLDGKTAINLD